MRVNWSELVEAAKQARKNAYAPYSQFPVGAALLSKSGRIYTGCNVENSSYGLTICAERNAIFSAVAAGEREFEALVIAAKNAKVYPCGACRQVLAEFCDDLTIRIVGEDGEQTETRLSEILPHAFRLKGTQ